MNRMDLYKAFGEMDDGILERSEQDQKANRSIRIRWGTAAACFLFLVSMSLTAEASTGAVSNLLAPLFGTAQTEIVDDIGVPVGVSASADGYTLTCDAIIGDRYNVAIVYTLSRDDGQPIPEGADLRQGKTSIWSGSGGGARSRLMRGSDPSKLYFTEEWSYSTPVIGRLADASYAQLEIRDENGSRTLLANGPWELRYTLRYKDTTVTVPVTERNVTDESGETYRIRRISVSKLGVHVDARWNQPRSFTAGEALCRDFRVSVRFTDGETLFLEDNNKGVNYKEGAKTANFDYTARFDFPVELEAIQAVVICGREYPVSP